MEIIYQVLTTNVGIKLLSKVNTWEEVVTIGRQHLPESNQCRRFQLHRFSGRKRNQNPSSPPLALYSIHGKVMVYLKSFKKSLVNVALATIESKDPLKKVGGCDLGCEYWEVAINVAHCL
ncbi:hypothetical protein Taro_001537 [Colocasia esculenta]|uniref:Transposase Tnp1/En/Spm-like domain-containing protein n=1 Tax=Colocasia esculenta TaxID=4460 RepID=A0A843TJB4_COLES|nr:hypothetical protein [Colocasia esculenta]